MKKLLAILLIALCALAQAAPPGRYFGSTLGPSEQLGRLISSGAATFAMPSLNNGFAARFIATQNKDVTAVKVNWATVTAAGQVEVRIETVDATTRKPTGTLYDANATVTAAPTAGWQTFTFASAPTTNLIIGTEYAVVILTTTGGTAHTIRYLSATAESDLYPLMVMTATDGTTRSNFTTDGIAHSVPIASLVLDDATEDPMGMIPYATTTVNSVFGTAATASKIVVVGTMTLAGILAHVQSNGTPAGDLRVRIFDSGDSVVSNSTVTIDKDSLITRVAGGGAQIYAPFGPLVSLASGTYRVVFDSQSSVNSSNCWRITSGTPAATGLAPSGFVLSTTADVTAGTISWTDSATADQVLVQLAIDDITVSGSQVGIPSTSTLGGVIQR